MVNLSLRCRLATKWLSPVAPTLPVLYVSVTATISTRRSWRSYAGLMPRNSKMSESVPSSETTTEATTQTTSTPPTNTAITTTGASNTPAPATLYCVNHPDTETLLRWNRCERPICLRCAVLTDVGY